MEQEQNTPQMPDLSGEEMKMPENKGSQSAHQANASQPVNGTIIAVLVLLLIMILGGMYYWFSQLTEEVTLTEPTFERPTAEENNEPESTTAEAEVEALISLSTSDELAAIEADIAATDLRSIDAELAAIQAELDSALVED